MKELGLPHIGELRPTPSLHDKCGAVVWRRGGRPHALNVLLRAVGAAQPALGQPVAYREGAHADVAYAIVYWPAADAQRGAQG